MDTPEPPVKKRGPGRPRKEERRKGRGRKPNPDKLKVIAAENKLDVNNVDSKTPDVTSKTKTSEVNDVENKQPNENNQQQDEENNANNNIELNVPEKGQDEESKENNIDLDVLEKDQDAVKETQMCKSDAPENKLEDTLGEKGSPVTNLVENKQDKTAEVNIIDARSSENILSAAEQEPKTSESENCEEKQETLDLQQDSEVNNSDGDKEVLDGDKISEEQSSEISDSKTVTAEENSDISDTEDDGSFTGLDSFDTAQMGQDSDQMESITDISCQGYSLVQKEYSASLSEAPVRMKEKLPECVVLLHRLTEEEINRPYPDDYYINADIKSKTEELLYKTVEAVNASYDNHSYSSNKDRSQRRVHKAPVSSKAFELYKRKREGYIRRRNNRSSFSENSLDYSQDEFRTYNSDGEKPKKKLKRGHKYERDFEWRPNESEDTFYSTRPRRQCTNRTVIESDSSTSDDEEDILYNIYMGYDIDDKTALQEKLPSKGDVSTSSVKNSAFISNSFNNCSDMQQNKNHSLVTDLNTSSSKSKSDSGDILSGIIANMNDLQRNKLKAANKSSKPVGNLPASNTKPKSKQWQWRKISNSSSEADSKKAVAMLLRELVNKVSLQTKLPNSGAKKFMNICKWCNTQFPTNRKTDVWCAICVDLRHGGTSKSIVSKKKPSLEKIRPVKENKVKKVNATMSRVLKNLPQSEKQRLMYAEKTGKMSVEKGYSHLKSFTDLPNKSNKSLETSQNKVTISKSVENNSAPNSQNKISITVNKIPVKPLKRKSSCDNINSNKNENITPGKLKTSVNGESESKQSKESISFKKCTEGLFLMNFPDPDKELDLEGQTLSLPNEIALQNKKAHNNINDKASNISVAASSNNEQQLINNKQFETYLFPPLPTVVVSNYSSDSNNLNLSNTFFQNEITHQQALKNARTILPAIKSKDYMNISLTNNPVTVTNTVSYQNSPYTTATLLPNNSPITITAIPISSNVNSISVNNGVSQIQPITIRSVPVLNTGVSVNNSSVSLLPVVSSVMTLAGKTNLQLQNKNDKGIPARFSQQNYVNSKQTEIRIDNVTSLKTYKKHDSLSNESNSLGGVTIMPLDSDNVSDCNPKEQFEISGTNIGDKSSTRKRSISDSSEFSEMSKITKSNSSANDSATESTGEQKMPENLEESLESKQSDNSGANKENAAPQTPISAAIDMLGAISILAVIDLEKNPHSGLNCRIQVTKTQLNKLLSEKNSSPEHSEKIASCQYNIQLLNIAKKYLSLYGSFIKVSDHLLRKAKISQMIQIKKEIFEESTQQSSCMYSQSSKTNNSLSGSQSDLSETAGITPPAINQIENFNSSRPSNRTPINHIEKLQSQIAAMNNANIDYSQYGSFPVGGTVHHYAADQIASLPPGIGAPTPVTPRNDCLMGESRETPSRGSGPRTPARPESAASQAEEQSLIQIKKEQFESASSPPTQCAYSQNTNLVQMSSQVPVISQVPTMPQHTVVSAPVHIPPVSSNQIYSSQTNYSVQQTGIGPNRTVSYTSNQNYSDVYLNVGTKHQLQISPVAQPQEMNQNRQVILPQQMFIQNGPGLCSKQAVPSMNNNQYIIRQPSYSSNTSGTVIVNNPQVGQNALLTNVSNQQFYTSNQVSQLYYPQSSPISAVVTQDIAGTQIQQADILEPEQMLCAVCNSQATLRCKQCARVAYCNTTCAKTYWHQKHKMECKPLGS